MHSKTQPFRFFTRLFVKESYSLKEKPKKKILLILVAFTLMASQCDEDETLLQTNFIVQNDTSIDLIFITEAGDEVIIESGDSLAPSSAVDETFIAPADHSPFTSLTLFKTDTNGDWVQTYEQNPITKAPWVFNEQSPLDANYTLVLTDSIIE